MSLGAQCVSLFYLVYTRLRNQSHDSYVMRLFYFTWKISNCACISTSAVRLQLEGFVWSLTALFLKYPGWNLLRSRKVAFGYCSALQTHLSPKGQYWKEPVNYTMHWIGLDHAAKSPLNCPRFAQNILPTTVNVILRIMKFHAAPQLSLLVRQLQ